MLVLTRKTGQSIIIGNNITVTVARITGGQVALAIDAPTEVTVNREEIQNKIDKGIPRKDTGQ